MAETPTSKEAKDKGAELLRRGQKWLERIKASEKREKSWMDDAEAAEKAYSCDRDTKSSGKHYDFNILHSNVETIVPAIYNSTPVPDVRSRNTLPQVEIPEPPPPPQPGQPPPDPMAVIQFQQAMQQAQAMQAQVKAVKDFASMVERAITVQIDDNKLDTEVEACAQDAFLSGRGIVRMRFHADDDGGSERLSFEAVSWRDYRRGPAKRWEERPWEAFRQCMPREEVERFTDKELLGSQYLDGDSATKEEGEDDIVVWEIWCKDDRYVEFVRDSDGKIIKRIEDPLGLSGFFPIATPVQPISLTGKLNPVCPFTVYKKLADELDLCTKRINAIMKGLKVRGLVAGDVSDIMNLAQADDNELVSASNLEGLAQTKGLEGAVMWWPIEQAIKVLKELYLQREQIKQSIYELTGISDIVRGASNAQETATAQQIKTQWGSLRIQKMQRLIQRMVRDLFIMAAEIITTKFSRETLQSMTGIQITPDIEALMGQKVLAYYRIDVESDSTVKADTTRIRQELGEFMQGTQAFFAAFAPIVQGNPEAAAPVAAIFQSVANNFNLGKQTTDALEELVNLAKQAAKKPRPNPEQEKMKAQAELEKMKAQLQAQIKQAELAMDGQRLEAELAAQEREAQIDAQAEQAKVQAGAQKAQIDMQKALIDLQIKKLELEMKAREMSMGLEAKQAETSLKLDAQRQSNEMKAEQAKQASKQKEPAQ